MLRRRSCIAAEADQVSTIMHSHKQVHRTVPGTPVLIQGLTCDWLVMFQIHLAQTLAASLP